MLRFRKQRVRVLPHEIKPSGTAPVQEQPVMGVTIMRAFNTHMTISHMQLLVGRGSTQSSPEIRNSLVTRRLPEYKAPRVHVSSLHNLRMPQVHNPPKP